MLASVLGMISGGVTHLAVATDHVIESFRKGLWPGCKTGAGIEPDLAQFPLLEETLFAAGVASGPWWSSRRMTRPLPGPWPRLVTHA